MKSNFASVLWVVVWLFKWFKACVRQFLKKIINYHLYFDNIFTNSNLLVHLKNVGLIATGTDKSNRMKAKTKLTEKQKKGRMSCNMRKTAV